MTSTETDETGGQPVDAGYTKRFVTSATSESQASSDEGESSAETTHEASDGPLMSRRAAISGVGMGIAAVLCFVLAAGFSGGAPQVSEEVAQQVFDLRGQVKTTKMQTEALPDAEAADRGLITAQSSADEIATLQNDYRILTPDVAAADGVLDPAASLSTSRNLTPYFAPSVAQSALQPWYLLASDKDNADGVGIPMSFDSGFKWVAQRPYLINEDSTIEVTWLAVQTNPAEGQPAAVLAWARADYDMTRKTFMNVETGTTTTGEALRQAVKTS